MVMWLFVWLSSLSLTLVSEQRNALARTKGTSRIASLQLAISFPCSRERIIYHLLCCLQGGEGPLLRFHGGEALLKQPILMGRSAIGVQESDASYLQGRTTHCKTASTVIEGLQSSAQIAN